MRAGESSALLSKGVAGLDAARVAELSRRLGEWPLAIELASAMMRQRIEQGDSAEKAAQRLLQILDKRGPRVLARGTGELRHRNMDAVLEGSLELLSGEDRTHLTELSIFPEDIPIPLSAASALWGLDEVESEETAQRLARLYLLKLDFGNGSMRLHDVMRGWLAAKTNATALHGRLVDAWSNWMRLPDAFAWRWLTWHLMQAGRTADIERILWDPAWLKAKLNKTDVNALIGDFEYLKPSREAELVQGALRLSSHVLARDPAQFASQMAGRLLPHDAQPSVHRFTVLLTQTADCPWLRLRQPALDPPGTGLLRTLAGHSNLVYGVAVSPDGRRAVSASEDNTLKVWDLETGAELRTLAGHSNCVIGVAVSPDGRRAVSASDDHTLKVWDLETGASIATFDCDSAAHCGAFADNHTIVAGDNGGRVYFLTLELPQRG